jgi:radical SAM protein with 4Fe4S-binding SPASM domain
MGRREVKTVVEAARPGTAIGNRAPMTDAAGFARPYVVSWNLTYRCNQQCEHCYLDAGAHKAITGDDAFADRSELSTEECLRVVDQIVAFAPEALTILTGGEPLLRRDILEIVRYAAAKELWVVVGTNGVKITEPLARLLSREGVRGLALSLDALDAARHDGFRRVRGAWANTVAGTRILSQVGLPFIVQTTVGAHNRDELSAIADFAHDELGAKVWNLYFLVPTGRGQFVSDLERADYDQVLRALGAIQRRFAGRMVVNAKCAPHSIRELLAEDPSSPLLRTFSGGAGGCPAGTHYMGIRPNGDVTPCPYLPVFGGNLRRESLADIWRESEVFTRIRQRDALGGRCGECELGRLCGGCRARAYGATGDLMAEDPLCSHLPGTFSAQQLATLSGSVYGASSPRSLAWEPEAEERMKRVPAFVRGMVVRAVESHCARSGIERVTVAELEAIRARMPTPKVFGRG